MNYSERETLTNPSVVTQTVDYHDRVRWGPIFGGIVVAIAVQLLLSALGTAIGLMMSAGNATAGSVSLGVGIWSIISLLIALFVAGWIMARTCGPMNKKTALLNGTILWATTLALSSLLLAWGVSGVFGVVAAGANAVAEQLPAGSVDIPQQAPQAPSVAQAEQFAANAAKAAWSFLLGALLAWVAAMIGASVGARKPRVHTVSHPEYVHQ
ncbi:MAG: hypothetical protein SAJ12_08360 [Jaaginema sp. PMC 1079.18]|nr:hypothetical protein [Jaaginema sp. PMC 1080.18]MEC4851010.1 hypothetical protein [Jaaginema sp. PMC 1079.18]MEC4868292.1 hypothetical protein [Jaaginema sp. PMC 1078.18]